MPKEKETNRKDKNKKDKERPRPALTPEARENQLISLAVNVAEQQLRDGTATSQVITHYLKLGSTNNQIEKEILKKRSDLMAAKTEALQAAKRVEELYANALDAMKNYSGNGYDPLDDGETYDEY